MTLYPIESGNFKLDGGAMFGVVPKTLWEKTNPADNNNRIKMATRSLLIEHEKKLILIDTGLGNKQSDKFFGYYDLWGNHSIENSLKNYGFNKNDITDVFFTHLHFDHCGGAIEINKKGDFRPAFNNASFWVHEDHWNWATHPNPREKASFLKENILPMQESGQLKFIENKESSGILKATEIYPGISVHFANGHTEAQMLPRFTYKEKTIIFIADLLPTHGHIPLPYIMGYDTRPLLTLTEKEKFLKQAAEQKYVIYLQHDNYSECCTVEQTDRGVRLKETFTLSEIL